MLGVPPACFTRGYHYRYKLSLQLEQYGKDVKAAMIDVSKLHSRRTNTKNTTINTKNKPAIPTPQLEQYGKDVKDAMNDVSKLRSRAADSEAEASRLERKVQGLEGQLKEARAEAAKAVRAKARLAVKYKERLRCVGCAYAYAVVLVGFADCV